MSKELRTFLQKYLSDVLILVGGLMAVCAVGSWSWIAGFFLAGVFLVTLGVLIALGNRPAPVPPPELKVEEKRKGRSGF